MQQTSWCSAIAFCAKRRIQLEIECFEYGRYKSSTGGHNTGLWVNPDLSWFQGFIRPWVETWDSPEDIIKNVKAASSCLLFLSWLNYSSLLKTLIEAYLLLTGLSRLQMATFFSINLILICVMASVVWNRGAFLDNKIWRNVQQMYTHKLPFLCLFNSAKTADQTRP